MSFLREPSGKLSMVRLISLILAIDASGLAWVAGKYLLGEKPEASVLAAVATVIGCFVAAGCVALLTRSKGEPPV